MQLDRTPHPAEPITDIREMFLASAGRFAGKVALQYKKEGRWNPIRYRDLRDAVEETACGFAALGLEPGRSRIAILGDNRPEWAISYLAAACTGIVNVPVDRDLRETEIYHILCLSGARVLVADAARIGMAREIREKLPDLEHVVVMNEAAAGRSDLGFERVRRMGRARMESGINDFALRPVTPDDVLAILFTSGTMGDSRGVVLTHANVAANLYDAARWVEMRADDRFLSVLPLHHSYECSHGFLLPLYVGATISYAENLRRVVENLAETKSTVVLGVPLLWHALYRKIDTAVAERGRWKFAAAKRIARFSETFLGMNIRRKLFAPIHRKLGGSLRTLISGGAAINPAVSREFRELGLNFLQGYGLTESSPIIAVNRDRAFKDGAAGLPLPSVEVRIAEDGEILARGPSIMKEYYENPEATREALSGGWLHTGDLGYLDEDGFLYIKGRKKSVIVTPAGKKIYPEEVEAEILNSPLVLECLVWGTGGGPDRYPEVHAAVVPNVEYCLAAGLGSGGMLDRARVEDALCREVKRRSKNLAPFKRITGLTVRYEEFEKTTTSKIKRYLYTGGCAGRSGGRIISLRRRA